MTRYRVIDSMHKDAEKHLSDDVDRAVNDDRVFLLEEVEDE